MDVAMTAVLGVEVLIKRFQVLWECTGSTPLALNADGTIKLAHQS